MSELEFYLLSLDERAELVFSDGKFAVETTEYYNHKIVLYSLYTFWVEVHYSIEDNMIDQIQVAGPQEMKKFLNKISIDPL
jgi:hypothetical protein